MTQILNISRTEDGQFQISDASGHMVEGPFDTNSAAWKALDRLDNDNAGRPDKQRSNKPVIWGKPERPKKLSKREKKLAAKKEHQMKVNAAKAPTWIRSVAAAKFDPAGERAYRDYKLGTFGAASDVKRIDPAVYLAEKAARGE